MIPLLQKYNLLPIFIILIFFLGFFLRFYHIATLPPGLYPDETAIGYNAYSILLTGKDEYGVSHPLYFRSYDDYKMPVYIYATALVMKVVGVNAFAVRFLSALVGSITIIALFFLIYELSRNKLLAALISLLFVFNPWQLFFSRAGYEVNVATGLLVIGTLFFIMAVKRKNALFLFIASIICFIISLYTYNVTRIVAPLLFASLVFLYYKKITANSKHLLLGLLGLFILGMLPFFITYITLQSQPGFAAQNDAIITGKVARADMLQTRSYFVGLPAVMQKLFFNYGTLIVWKWLGNLVAFFSTGFFFLVGADHPDEGVHGFGMLYYFDFPLLIFGAYLGLKRKITFLYPFYLWFLIMLLVGSIIIDIPKDDAFGTRTFPVIIPLIVFSGYGLYSFLQIISRLKNQIVQIVIVLGTIGIIGYSYVFYLTTYFVRFPVENAPEWQADDVKAVTYISSIADKYHTIIFDPSSHFLYTSLLFYGKYPPLLHQEQAIYAPSGLVDTVIQDGKYEFRKVDWQKDLATPGTLVITGKDNLPTNLQPLTIFTYPPRPVVLYYDRKIAQYPVTDVAYEVFQSPGSE